MEIRIGDRDRSAVDAQLRQGLDDGVLTLGEYTIAVPPGQDRVVVGMLFGSLEVVLPEVRVDVHGAFGSVRIVTQSESR